MGWQRVRHDWAMNSFTFTFQNLRRGWRQEGNKCVWKSNVSDSCDDIGHLGHLDLPILSVILDSNFARCYHWWWAAAGEWGKGTWDFSVSSVQFSYSVVSNSLRPHEPQHARPPCPSPTPRVYSNSRPLSQWCYPTISFSVIPLSSCPQSFPASGSFQMSQLCVSGGPSIEVSASTSVLPMNT